VQHAFKLVDMYQSKNHAFAPAFIYKEGGTLKVLTYSKFTSKLKKTLDKSGIDNWKFSGHSFWREGATFALHWGVPSNYIKLQGDWKSNAYEQYLDR